MLLSHPSSGGHLEPTTRPADELGIHCQAARHANQSALHDRLYMKDDIFSAMVAGNLAAQIGRGGKSKVQSPKVKV